MKTTWNIVKSITDKKTDSKAIQSIDTGNAITPNNQQDIADAVQNYILSVADKLKSNSKDNCDNECMHYLFRVFKKPS